MQMSLLCADWRKPKGQGEEFLTISLLAFAGKGTECHTDSRSNAGWQLSLPY
jgi:hypothetical protein